MRMFYLVWALYRWYWVPICPGTKAEKKFANLAQYLEISFFFVVHTFIHNVSGGRD